jgi:tetraacyldisaccharide 4'-kinase
MSRSAQAPWKLILVPFSWLFGLGVRIRNFLYDHDLVRSTAFHIPLISVGNLAVGGTGKTPHTEYLVELLGRDYRVATLSRGYRRRTRDFRIAGSGSTVAEVGDEAMQIKTKYPEITVAVDRRRVHGVRELMKSSPPPEVIILDDAYQHRSLRPGLSILLIDYHRPILGDRLLPAGRLREPASNRDRANMILVTRTPGDLHPDGMQEYADRLGTGTGQHLFFTSMQYGKPVPVFPELHEETGGPLRILNNPDAVLLVTGIADRNALRDYGRELCPKVEELRFADHRRYGRKDRDKIRARFSGMSPSEEGTLVLTTEKDAVKFRELDLPEPLRRNMFAVPIRVHFLNDERENFHKQIHTYVSSNT